MGFNSGFKGLIKHTTYIDIRFVPRNKKADHKGAEQRMLPPGSAAYYRSKFVPTIHTSQVVILSANTATSERCILFYFSFYSDQQRVSVRPFAQTSTISQNLESPAFCIHVQL